MSLHDNLRMVENDLRSPLWPERRPGLVRRRAQIIEDMRLQELERQRLNALWLVDNAPPAARPMDEEAQLRCRICDRWLTRLNPPARGAPHVCVACATHEWLI